MRDIPDLIIKRHILITYPPGADDGYTNARKRLHAVLCLTADDEGRVTISESDALALSALKENRDSRRAWADLLETATTADDQGRRMTGDNHPIVLVNETQQTVLVADYLIGAWQMSDDALERPQVWCDAVINEAVTSGLPAWQGPVLAKRLADHAASLIENLAPDRVDEHTATVTRDLDDLRRDVNRIRRQSINRAQRRERLQEQESLLRTEVQELHDLVASYDDPTEAIIAARDLAEKVISLADKALGAGDR